MIELNQDIHGSDTKEPFVDYEGRGQFSPENAPPALAEKRAGGVGVSAPAPTSGGGSYIQGLLKKENPEKKSTASGGDGINAWGVKYDRWGRMGYHPEYHPKHRQAWSNADEKYLIENYELHGPCMVAAALGRTIGVVMTRACELRKTGKMPRRSPGAKVHNRARHA